MKVKIGDTYYDSTKEPIMLIITPEEKVQIGSDGEFTRYCSYPYSYSKEQIEEFMDVDKLA